MQHQSCIGSTEGGGLHRLALSDEDKAIRDWFLDSMEAAGLETRIDQMGNMFGRRPGTRPNASPVLIGSHLDSQPYGGVYDGALGVVAALELVRTLNDRAIETTKPLEIVNWTNEEGARFQPAMQGSGVWAGDLDLEEEYSKTDESGKLFEDELERIGYKGETKAKPIEDYDSFIELHIEQGPVLDKNSKDIGIVSGVAGLSWGTVTFYGEAGHTGTTPMYARHDALVAAGDLITAVRRIASGLSRETVGSVGYIDVSPNSINTVPGEVTVSWGIRDPKDDIVKRGRQQVLAEIDTIADREALEYEWEDRARSSSIIFPTRTVSIIKNVTDDLGYDGTEVFSGAVHDAAKIGSICDTGMIFAASKDGKSHTEAEFTSWEDCYKAANTLANAGLRLANE
jgi:N-carbamoyl-L-amino-acid hydrolase